jgi:hypothetical protein
MSTISPAHDGDQGKLLRRRSSRQIGQQEHRSEPHPSIGPQASASDAVGPSVAASAKRVRQTTQQRADRRRSFS